MKNISLIVFLLMGSCAQASDITKKLKMVYIDCVELNLNINTSYNLIVGFHEADFDEGYSSNLMTMNDCKNVKSQIDHLINNYIVLNGNVIEKPYQELEKYWGKCHDHPLAGGGYYPCEKTRQVTKYKRKITFDLFGTSIFKEGIYNSPYVEALSAESIVSTVNFNIKKFKCPSRCETALNNRGDLVCYCGGANGRK